MNSAAQLQAARADEVLSLVQVQQQRGEDRGKVEALQTHLMEEQRRSQQLEETLKHQVQQSSSHISMKQVNYFCYKIYSCVKLRFLMLILLEFWTKF